MNEEDLRQVQEAMNKTLNERDSLDHDIHRKHHDYIDTLIIENKIKAERYENMRRQAIGWGIFVFLTSTGTAVYNYFFKGN